MTITIDRKWWVLIAVGTGTFMSALDGSVVNTILPIVRDAFKSDVAAIEWLVTVYLLVLSGLLLTFGRLGDLRGPKSVYVWGFSVFVASSALCGVSWSPIVLAIFRGVQAIGAAMLASNSPAIVADNSSYHLLRRALYHHDADIVGRLPGHRHLNQLLRGRLGLKLRKDSRHLGIGKRAPQAIGAHHQNITQSPGFLKLVDLQAACTPDRSRQDIAAGKWIVLRNQPGAYLFRDQ